MPSAKARAAKAATAARVASYNAAAAALDADAPVKTAEDSGFEKLLNLTGNFESLHSSSTVAGAALASPNSSMLFKPTLPSMLNLNTKSNMNRALAVGAVTVTPGQNGNPSDEENVHPMVPGATPTSTQKVEERNVDGVGYVGRPLSPILGHINNEKGARAYEFERQKVKRAGELVKRKAAKAAKAAGSGCVAGGGGHSYSGRVAFDGNGADGGRREARSRILPNDMDVDIPEILVEKPLKKPTTGIKKEEEEMPSDGRIEVSLSEFVLRQKKPRKVKGLF